MPDLSHRSTLPEKMDQPGVPAIEIDQAVHELEVINTWLGGYSVVLNALKKIKLSADFSLLDMGSGGGDMLRNIYKWSGKYKYNPTLTGVDRNPLMTARATKTAGGIKSLQFITADVFDDQLLALKPDVVTSTLFCHHFDDTDLVQLVKRKYELAQVAVVINDLHRHPIAYHSIKWITKYFSKSYLVQYDAALSVARSLTRIEWQNILSQAGINSYSITWKWAWRWQIIIPKTL